MMIAAQTLRSASLVVVLASCAIAHADPAPTGTFEVGAGFSSVEGFIATARVAQSNLFGTGHSLAVAARISGRDQQFALDYRTADLGEGLRLGASLFNVRTAMPHGLWRQSAGGQLMLDKELAPNLRVFGGYRFEHVAMEGVRPIASGKSLPPLGGGMLATARFGIEYNSVDRQDAPTRGTRLLVGYDRADKSIGSDWNLERFVVKGSHHQPLGPAILHVGGSFTHVASGDGLVPISERLYLDGVNDTRGFAPGTFGMGDTRILGRAELEVPLFKRIGLSAVGFVEGGGIVDNGMYRHGAVAGFGLLWRSPIGALRFDWSVPIEGGPARFTFGIGVPW